jgi:small-conductance mechanosensitive channel
LNERMLKLIGIIVAAIPVVLFLRGLLAGRVKRRSPMMADFRRRIDRLVWILLLAIACAIIYTVAKLIYG